MRHSNDFYEAGFEAWKTLTLLLGGKQEPFTSIDEFIEFYDLVVDKLLSAEMEE